MRVITAYTEGLENVGNIDPIKIFKPEELKSYWMQTNWPQNRGEYCTAQGGEFTDWLEDEVICFTDADIIQQRDITHDDIIMMTPAKGEFKACYNSYPPKLLNDVLPDLLPSYPITDNFKKYIEFQAGVLIAHRQDWVRLKGLYLEHYKDFMSRYKHHAMTQLLINYLIQEYFTLQIMPPHIHNGYWLGGTKAYKGKDGKMWYKDKIVLFNHFKFEDQYR